MRKHWYLSDKIMDWSGKKDYWRLRDACEGVQVFGDQGGGKTSGPMHYLAKSYLANEFGALILCAKTEEVDTWQKYIRKAGREDDIILLSKNYFDFLKYEADRKGEGAGEIENIVDVFMEIAEMANRSEGGAGNDAYWERAGRQILRNTITLLKFSDAEVTLGNISKLISSLPGSSDMLNDKEWQGSSYCYELFNNCYERGVNTNTETKDDFEVTERFMLKEYPELDPRTRGNIVSFFSTLADGFLRGTIRKIFCSGKVNITPEMCQQGKIIIVDLSINKWKETGRFAAGIMKYLVQVSLERRPDKGMDTARPVFVFGDESHFFVTKHDQMFQTTTRSARGCVVYATQNYPNYLSALKRREIVDSLLGNLGTKIFCHNGDKETNKWAAETIDRIVVKRHGSSARAVSTFLGDVNKTHSTSEQKDFILDPLEFQQLKKGGKEYNYKVGSIIWQGGRTWSNKKSYLKVKFDQRNQKFRNNGNFFKYIIYGLAAVFFLILASYMVTKESVNIISLYHYYTRQFNPFYVQGVIYLGVGGIIYMAVSNIEYVYSIIKMTVFIMLCLNAFYLYRFSPLHIKTALAINIYLLFFCLYAFLKGGVTTDSEVEPLIMRG